MASYEQLTKEEREEVPQELRVWLRYRSEKYFGKGRTGNGMSSKPPGPKKAKPKAKAPLHVVASRKVASDVGPLYLYRALWEQERELEKELKAIIKKVSD